MNIDLSDAQYTEIITLLIGLALFTFGLSMGAKRKKLLSSGSRVEGVVYSIEKDITYSSDSTQSYIYPIVRFVTAEKEWVTEKYEYAVSSANSIANSAYKEGDKVAVIYDPKNSKNFILDDVNSRVADKVFMFIGLLLVISSAIYYYLSL